MALVVLLRGVNVGGNKTFRPKLLADQLKAFDVVNIGAAGTFVVRKPGTKTKFLGALKKKLPVQCEVIVVEGKELLRLETEHPFGAEVKDVVRFVSTASAATAPSMALPFALPESGQWLVRVIHHDRQFAFGEYRRHMKTIGYLATLDRLFGVPVTTRNWNTILAIARILRDDR